MTYVNKVQELIGNSLLKATRLQAVHIDWAAPRVKGTDFSYVSTRDVLQVANQCSPTLTQIGCSSRVWQVGWVSNVRFGEPYTKLGCKGSHTSRRRSGNDYGVGTMRMAGGP